MINPFITLNGAKYAVAQGSYSRDWMRSFTSYLAANIVRLNFIDRGPGVQTYTLQLMLMNWPSSSVPYKNGITTTPEAQMAALEATYQMVATPVSFIDPFGNTAPFGVYMTDLKQTIPNWATPNQTFILATIQLTQATQLVN